ncbi:MAG: hypothetical protein HYV24_06450 [Deltaproteobacteria bacterium]|nr:hypothetical protein [Deltaproteobacteria bacterium]
MANEVSVSAVLVEEEDGTYRASCPEAGIEVKGMDSEDTVRALKDAVTRRIREVGAANIQLKPVKCLKFKVPVD